MKRLLALLWMSLSAQAMGANVIDTSGLRVQGNKIVNGSGQSVFIHGGNRFDTTLCQHGHAHTQPQGSDYTRTRGYQEKLRDQWNINSVRVMINEYCWRKSNEGVHPGVINGVRYVDAMNQLVRSITDSNMVAVVTLAVVAHDGSVPSILYENPRNAMPNVTYSIPVWRDMADLWKGNSRVIFDLYNEPTPYLQTNGNFTYDEVRAWTCLRDGRGACTANSSNGAPRPVMGDRAVGMQELLNTVRGTGATNVVLSPGTSFSGKHERWIEFKPHDPLNNLGTGMHGYNFGFDYPACKDNGVMTIGSLTRCVDRQHTQPNGVALGTVIPIVWTEYGSQSHASGGQCRETVFDRFVWQYALENQQGHMMHAAWSVNTTNGDITGSQSDVCREYALFGSYGRENNGTAPVTASIYGAPFKAQIQNLSWTFGDEGTPPPVTPPRPPRPTTGESVFQVRNVRAVNLCLQPEDGNPSIGDPISAKSCNSSRPAQAVSFPVNADGSERMMITSLCIGTPTGGFGNGTRLQLQACNGGTDQSFVINGTRIAPLNSQTQVMDLHGGNLNDVVFWRDHGDGSSNQRWSRSSRAAGGSPVVDTTPSPFNFASVRNVPLASIGTSNVVNVAGVNTATAISVTNGLYSIGCTATFTSEPSTISNGQAVCVRHTSANANSTSVTTILKIGGASSNFRTTTQSATLVVDTTPTLFVFAGVGNALPGSVRTSNTITVADVNAPAAVSVTNGQYSIGCTATFTDVTSTVTQGQTVCVRHSAANTHSTTVITTLKIGGVTSNFSSTTVPSTAVSGVP